jgi:hypothetical protein
MDKFALNQPRTTHSFIQIFAHLAVSQLAALTKSWTTDLECFGCLELEHPFSRFTGPPANR